MPDKYSVATYAASASLATIALVYVFAPTYFLDTTPAGSGSTLSSLTNRKTGVVGLVNAANDCFINSILQALAGLGDLRIYLIRETHRREMDDAGVYRRAVPDDAVLPDPSAASPASAGGAGAPALPAPAPPRQALPVWKIEGLQAGLVTKGLKEMIDQLNERPLYRKVITARPFVQVLQTAFRKNISRSQQDAQEFLQIVAERLCDEYHAGRRARQYARQQLVRQASAATPASHTLNGAAVDARLAGLEAAAEGTATADTAGPRTRLPNGNDGPASAVASSRSSRSSGNDNNNNNNNNNNEDDGDDEEEGFPMEGKLESQIECLTCGFKPRPAGQTFCMLTLNVPQTSSTSLSACFDSLLKTEYIDEFKCEKCRLVHAQALLGAELAKAEARAGSQAAAAAQEARRAVAALQRAVETDPEQPPADVALPDVRVAPKRRIARHVRFVRFPKILAIHLSRSIFDVGSTSQKNSAKVAFPEALPLGGLLQQRRYKLISVVMHKGSHHSGHYESFRRQVVAPPYSNPNVPGPAAVFSPASTPAATTPRLPPSSAATAAAVPSATANGGSPASSTTELPAPAFAAAAAARSDHGRSSRSSSLRERRPAATTAAAPRDEAADSATETASLRSITRSTWSRIAPSSRSGSSRAGSRTGSRAGSQTSGSRRASVSGHGNGHSNGHGSKPAPKSAKQGAAATAAPAAPTPAVAAATTPRRKKKTPDRWWRISDERVREASTREVLGMQREVYLLFYELERENPYRR